MSLPSRDLALAPGVLPTALEEPVMPDQQNTRQPWIEEIPYGLRVADDGSNLVENPAEIETIILALDRIVDDLPLSQVAAEMNTRGYRMRNGQPWTPTALFTMLPRMIEMSPRLFGADRWVHRKQSLQRGV
jgi:hypothetical protein